MSDETPGRRISWLDGWRGIALYIMVAYHLLFDMCLFGWLRLTIFLTWPMLLVEKFSAYSFILCAGVSSTLTRSNVRRGVITLAAGAVVTAVSFLIDTPIRFGVLQFLGLAMLIYAGIGKQLQKLPERLAPILWLVLFAGFYCLTESVRVNVRWLFWLGFYHEGFESYDYFPLLPYIFLFFLGTWFGGFIKKRRDELPILDRRAPGWLAWPGRHTLWIYLLHQPALYGLCWLADRILDAGQ